jgi:fatty-acyl-CoA synthase
VTSIHPAPYWPEGLSRSMELPERTIDTNLELTAARQGDEPAIIFQGRSLSYSDLWQKVQALAGFLQNRAGVVKGDRVLLYMQNSPQSVIGYYAILRAGGVVVPVNPMNRHGELQYLIENTQASVMLIGLELAGNATPLLDCGQLSHVIGAAYAEMGDPETDIALPAPLPDLREADFTGAGKYGFNEAVAAGETPRERETTPDDLAVIPFSSGTTGQPKGCVHTHRTIMVTIVGCNTWYPENDDNVHLASLPFFHVTGMQSAMNQPIFSGGTVVILTRWNCVDAAKLIERHAVNRWASISTMMIDLLNNPETEQFDLKSLTIIGGGGAAMPEAIAKKLKARIGRSYIEGYGLSETMAGTHMNPFDAPRDQCLGVPVFDVDARIVELGGTAEVDIGEPGEIIMNAPQVFKGYWNNAEETAKAFVEVAGKQFFRTGDIARRDAEGYFYMVDRVKRMINVSGFKVWPAEVESLMLHNPDIAEACVVGSNDERKGEIVRAYVVAKANAASNADSIISWCREQMAAYKCPREILFVDSLPKSATGKVLWKDLS